VLSAQTNTAVIRGVVSDPGTTIGRDAGPYSDLYNRRTDYGPSANDVKNRLSFSSVYELPVGPGKAHLAKSVLGQINGGWTLGNVTVLQSGPPMSVTTQNNNTFAQSAGSQRSDVSRDPNLPSDQRSVLKWFDIAAFTQPANFSFGSSGCNIVRAPGLVKFDFSQMRNFKLHERYYLPVRGESFNAFNHTNFSAPGGTFGGAGFGTISASGPARQLQIGMRFAF